MAVLYTQAEVEARVAQASPPLVVLDRRFDIALPEQDELILGIQDVLGRCLNSDADGLFYLVGLAARTNAALAQRIGTNLTQFSRLAEAGNMEPPVATPAIDQLLGLLDQVEGAGDGQQEKIRQQFSTAVAAYARSSRTAAGAISVKPDPGSSKQSASLLVASILEDATLLLDNARLFVNAVTNFKAIDLTKASRDRHILYARILLQDHLGRAVTEQSDAIIDSIVANALLQYSAVRLDVEAAKAAGTLVMSALSAGTRVITLLAAPSTNAPIRIGDAVFATALVGGTYPVRVGTVTWVAGLQVTMTEAQGSGLPAGVINQPNAQYQIQILSQGLGSFRSTSPQVAAYVAQLANLLEGENRIQRALATYVESGVISPKLSASIQGLTSLSTNLATLFGQYTASRVQAVDGLISHLENERLDLLSSVLTSLQFSVLLDIPAVLSSQGQATYLMEELAEDANTGVGPQANEIASMMGDYFISGRP
jgi:hypothetical protein